MSQDFLSHGKPKYTLLVEHLVKVANRAKEIASESEFSSPKIAYYAGLFHDLGKLNPYYQSMFRDGWSKNKATSMFDNHHSPYSGWMAKSILGGNKTMTNFEKQRIYMIIYGHHGAMRQRPGNFTYTKKEGPVQVRNNWIQFAKSISKNPHFASIIPESVELNESRFLYGKKIKLSGEEESKEAFLQCGYYFSAVLQADWGSFNEWDPKKMDGGFKLDLEKLEKKSKLAGFRKEFQAKVLSEIGTTKPIQIISAPTGAGKTRAFLSLIESFRPDRVFYFSPLLALTDDISEKIGGGEDTEGIASNPEQILTYNHIFVGSLKEKKRAMSEIDEIDASDEEGHLQHLNFDHEAFNERFVLTTTQRLIMTLYSNRQRDKIKFASLRNSLLIVDEVQTLPKFLLSNLASMLKIMYEKMNTRTLLVSATIPHELRQQDIPIVSMSKNITKEYLDEKKRPVTIMKRFNVDLIESDGGAMVMFNTRKAAFDAYVEIVKKFPDAKYVSAGITKRHRDCVVSNVKKSKSSVLVTTQSLEAGVDISFKNIWRQLAPLDNIIQVLGRLDRESVHKDSACAYIFDIDNPNHIPYSEIEYVHSQTILKNMMPSTNTTEIYLALEEYYKKIQNENKTQKNNIDMLNSHIESLDFEEVWKFVKDHTGDQYYDDVYIPEKCDWNKCKKDLLSSAKTRHKKYESIKASLPIKAYKLDEKGYWDEELKAKDILLPKKDQIRCIYDKDGGLDKWITLK